MPVFWRCRNCRTLVGLNKKACPGCGAKPSRSKSQTYVVQVCYKKKRKSATVRSLTQAREVEARLKSQLIEEHHVPNPNRAPEMTFAEFCEKHYFPYAWVQNSSFRRAEPFFHKWILPRLGKKKLPEITPKDVEDLKATVLRAGRAVRTAQHVLALVRAALNCARKWGFLAGDNPASGIRVPRFDNRRVRFLTPDEAYRLLEECRRHNSPRNLIYPMVLLALTTGMRAGEIFRLRVQDLNLEEGVVHVRDAKSGENGVVYVSDRVRAVLVPLIKGKKPHEHVFSKPDGRPFKEVPDVWNNIVRDLKFNEGVTDPREKVVFHTLRHTFCSWLALDGVPLHVIKELARHKTIQMTERYAHLLPDVRRKAAEKVWRKVESGLNGEKSLDRQDFGRKD